MQFESGGPLEQLGPPPRIGPRGIDDVRADDRGKLDLHRDAGNFARGVRNVRGGGGKTFSRRLEGKTGGQWRHGRYRKEPLTCSAHEWGGVSGDRLTSGPDLPARYRPVMGCGGGLT